jgi:HD superfamily phosphohydrolase
MASAKRFSVLRDPVHGDVYLTHEEIAVLDTPEMQRLRGVKQLGTAYLVYPGALHTRFDHSVGVLHMTQRMIDAIQRSFELAPRDSLGISEREARVMRIAALVHDVTHIPFGHHFEDQAGLFRRHDAGYRFRRALAPTTELGACLERIGVRRDVLGILTAARGRREAEGADVPAVPPYWSQVLADTISSDILDYLKRDAYFTGLQLGVDARVTSYFKIDRASGNLYLDLAKRDLLREDILSEAVRLLEARYYFSERVYFHHAKVAAGALIAHAVELALVGGLVREEDLYDQTDASLLELLERRSADAEPTLAKRIRGAVQRFRERRLPKRACVFPRYENQAAQEDLVARTFAPGTHAERQAIADRIADLVRFSTGAEVEILLYCPAARMQLKEAGTHVRWPGEPELRPLSAFADRVPRLSDLERSYRDLWKFYVLADSADPRVLKRVQELALGEFPGVRNVYRIEDAN